MIFEERRAFSKDEVSISKDHLICPERRAFSKDSFLTLDELSLDQKDTCLTNSSEVNSTTICNTHSRLNNRNPNFFDDSTHTRQRFETNKRSNEITSVSSTENVPEKKTSEINFSQSCIFSNSAFPKPQKKGMKATDNVRASQLHKQQKTKYTPGFRYGIYFIHFGVLNVASVHEVIDSR